MISEWLKATEGNASAAFVLAHPDDEFFCLPLIAAELAGGRSVYVAYLTDGGPNASTRERESLGVLGQAGVQPNRVFFAGHEKGWRDGELHRDVTAARDWVGHWLTTIGQVARIYVTAYEGGHHDHDCCYGIVATLQRDGRTGTARALQFPLYTGRALPGPLFSTMTAIPENGGHSSLHFSARSAAGYWGKAVSYPSQWRSFMALGPVSMVPYLVRHSLHVQQVDPARILASPHAGLAYYERRFHVPAKVILDALATL